MTRYGRDPEAFARNCVIAFWHPRYADVSFCEALADVKRRRTAARSSHAGERG